MLPFYLVFHILLSYLSLFFCCVSWSIVDFFLCVIFRYFSFIFQFHSYFLYLSDLSLFFMSLSVSLYLIVRCLIFTLRYFSLIFSMFLIFTPNLYIFSHFFCISFPFLVVFHFLYSLIKLQTLIFLIFLFYLIACCFFTCNIFRHFKLLLILFYILFPFIPGPHILFFHCFFCGISLIFVEFSLSIIFCYYSFVFSFLFSLSFFHIFFHILFLHFVCFFSYTDFSLFFM